MTQSNRTLAYVAVAVVAVAIAYFSRSEEVAVAPASARESLLLFPEFKDPTQAASLEIMRFDPDTLSFDNFSVVEKNQTWTIPSHDDYPVDAKDQMVEAATLLSDLRVTSVETEADEEVQRQRFGLLDPTIENLQKTGGQGLGMKITVRDAKQNALVDMIVGTEVPGKPDQRYVALPGRGRVFTVKVDVGKLSTKFGDWIETDLLKLGSVWDVAKLSLQDYSLDVEQGIFQPRSQMTFARNQEKNEWDVVSLKAPNLERNELFADAPLGQDEELNQQAIDDLRSALSELKIVNVERKPEALRKSLREDGTIDEKSATSLRSLGARGFHIVPLEGKRQLLSADGELDVTMKDGVEYILRFGDVAEIGKEKQPHGDKAEDEKPGDAQADDEASDEKKSDEKKPDDGKDGVALHRYLFVMARFDENAIEKPKLEALPEAKDAETASPDEAEKKDQDGENQGAAKDDSGAAAKSDDGAAKPEEAQDSASPAESEKADENGDEGASENKPDADAEKAAADAGEGDPQAAAAKTSRLRLVSQQQDEPAKAAEPNPDDSAQNAEPENAGSADDKPADDKPADDKPADAQPASANQASEDKPAGEAKPSDGEEPAADAAESADDAAKKLEAERKRIEAENKRKQEEYEKKVADAKKKVKEANERFADWYYVIPESVYKKIHLSRADVIKKKEKPAEDKSPKSDSPSDFPDLPPTLGN